MRLLFDPVNGVFNIHFWLGGIATNMVGFGLCYLCYATEQHIKDRRYFMHATLALIVFMSGLSVFVSL